MQRMTLRQHRQRGLSKRTKNKIRIAILNILVTISIISIISFVVLVKELSTDGLILAAIINIPCAIFLILVCLANGVFDIPKRPKRKPKHDSFYNIEIEKPKKKQRKTKSQITKIESVYHDHD